MKVKDVTIYYPLKYNGVYVTTPYSFNEIVTNVSDAIDAYEFIKKSFLFKGECDEKCKQLNKNE